MKRLEQLRAQRGYNVIADDGSGWVSLSSNQAGPSNQNSDPYSPTKKRTRNDTPSPEPAINHSGSGKGDDDLSPPRWKKGQSPFPGGGSREAVRPSSPNFDISPPRRQRTRDGSPSAGTQGKSLKFGGGDVDLSPPRLQKRYHHSRSPEPKRQHLITREQDADMSPPRRRRARNDTASPEPKKRPLHSDLSPPRKGRRRHDSPNPDKDSDMSPPRKPRARNDTPSPELKERPVDSDISPPRKGRKRHDNSIPGNFMPRQSNYLSPSRKSEKESGRCQLPEIFPQHSHMHYAKNDISGEDLSPPRRSHRVEPSQTSLKERPKTGLISGTEIREEIAKTKKDEWLR